MITRLIFSFITIALSVTVTAQQKEIQYGFHGGVNFNSSHGSASINDQTSMSIGYNFGGHVKLRLINSFGLKAILQYEENGWSHRGLMFVNNSGTGLAEGDVQYKLSYLNLPVLAEYEYGRKIRFNVNAGLFVGALLNGKLQINFKDQPRTTSRTEGWRSFNYGISTGLGIQIPVKPKIHLAFDLRNNVGLANISKSAGSTQSSIKTISSQVSSGLVFRL